MIREEAIKILEKEKEETCLLESYGDGDTEWAKAYNMAIYALKHKPKTGRWIDTGSGQECSNCHEIQYGYDNHRLYCANCGSRNEVVKE